jgi:hypothetical protein
VGQAVSATAWAGELRGLVDARVREEVLYREALAMGLDQGDSVVRNRLGQKLEFLIEDLAAAREPSEATRRVLRGAPSGLPAARSFSHAYFSPDRRGRAAQADARLVLAGLRAGLSRPRWPIEATAS